MSYIEASDTSLRKTGQIKLHGPSGFAGMRKAGALVAKCLDELTDLVKEGIPTSEIDEFVRNFAFSNGAHVCEVEVDPDTGDVTLARYAIADDVGTVINPLTLKGQIHGGVAQGVGQALMEQVVYEPGSGQLLTASFMEYAMPRADTFCDVAIESHPVPTALNPLGAKGAGEAGTVGALPAVINAVMDALAPLGVRQLDMPASSDRVWQAIREVKTGRPPA